MAIATAPSESAVLHPRAAAFTGEPHSLERRVGLLFAATGVAVVALMGVLGLLMRLTQAEVFGLSPAWFYRLMTLHGAGMITGSLLALMGALWYVLRATVPLRTSWMLASYALVVAGTVAALAATLLGGFGAGWTFLPPLPFFPAGQWAVWSESLFFAALLLIGSGFFVYCLDVLERTAATYGGLTGALGWRYLRGRASEAPPPQAIAATVVAIDGLLAMAAGAAIVLGLLGRTYDASVGIDALVAKNLVYFFGHSIANLVIYLAAAALYVLMPRYAGRPYRTTKVFVVGWAASLVFIATAYSHHLYMDFVQPVWAQAISLIASYGALVPVAVITIYSMAMLVWGSAYRWTLASTLLYVGLGGWAIGGVGAVLDSLIPLNFRLHNTVWVVAHFHTYLMLAVVVWMLAFLVHLLERDADRTTRPAGRALTIGLLLVGGYGFTATWFVGGALGIPRRYAIQPPGTSDYSLVGSAFALLFALGVLVCLVQLVPLARAAWRRRHAAGAAVRPPADAGPREATPPGKPVTPPLQTGTQLALALAFVVAGVVAFLPAIVDAAEASVRYHHLDHAGQFLIGTVLGLLVGSLPTVSRLLGERPAAGLAAALLAPTALMLAMVPRFYESLERGGFEHALFHLGTAGLGLLTGLGASRLTPLGGRLVAFLSVGMALLFAAAMTGA